MTVLLVFYSRDLKKRCSFWSEREREGMEMVGGCEELKGREEEGGRAKRETAT